MLSKTLISLYTGSINAICTVLNKTIYITDLKEKEHFLFHTGFSFRTHKEKKMFVYYQFRTGILVRGPESTNALYGKFPELIGLFCRQSDDGYIKDYSLTGLGTQIYLDGEVVKGNEIAYPDKLQVVQESLELKAEDGSIYTHSEFVIFDGEKELYKFPLYKEYEKPIFYDMHSFKEYVPSLYQRERPNVSNEEWYRQEFGDDWETAWWNTH